MAPGSIARSTKAQRAHRRTALRSIGIEPIEPALMNIAHKSSFALSQRHLLGSAGLSREGITGLFDLAEVRSTVKTVHPHYDAVALRASAFTLAG